MSAPRSSSDPTDVLGRRALAWILDGVIAVVIVGFVFFSQAESLSGVPSGFCDLVEQDSSASFCVQADDTVYVLVDDDTTPVVLAWIGLAIAVPVVLQGLTGWTPGKLALGLRCVDDRGRPCGIGRAALRTVLWIVDGIPGVPLVGGIAAAATPHHRRVGDLVAKTRVVTVSAMGRPIDAPAAAAPPAWAPPTDAPWSSPAPTPSPVAAAAGTAPPAPPPAPPAAPAADPSSGGATEPHWDAARGTWLQWDGARWLGWDATTRTWQPL